MLFIATVQGCCQCRELTQEKSLFCRLSDPSVSSSRRYFFSISETF